MSDDVASEALSDTDRATDHPTVWTPGSDNLPVTASTATGLPGLPPGYDLTTAHIVALLTDEGGYLADWSVRCPCVYAEDEDDPVPLTSLTTRPCAVMKGCPVCGTRVVGGGATVGSNAHGDPDTGHTDHTAVAPSYVRHGVRHVNGLVEARSVCGLWYGLSHGQRGWAESLCAKNGSGMYLVQPCVDRFGEMTVDPASVVRLRR